MKKCEQARPANRWPSGVSMKTNLPFHRSGTGPAGRRAGRVPALPSSAIRPPRQPAIPDEGRSTKYPAWHRRSGRLRMPSSSAIRSRHIPSPLRSAGASSRFRPRGFPTLPARVRRHGCSLSSRIEILSSGNESLSTFPALLR